MALTNAFSNLALDTSVQDVKTALDGNTEVVQDIKTALDASNLTVDDIKTALDASNLTTDDIKTALDAGISVIPDNITGKFRDSFESFTDGVNWDLTTSTGDIVQLDGNTASASYLVISKDPLTASGTATTLEMLDAYTTPIETSVGLSMSQRVLGQEVSMELISNETPLPSPQELEISSISQTTTTLTVTTASNHNLVPGMRIGIYGVADSRLNYPSLVVAGLSSLTQFTCTAGPGGTIPSVTSSTYTSGYVYIRSTMGGAPNGISEIFENATVTNASGYTRANAGDALASGTQSTNHSVTIATTASTQVITSQYSYAFLPTSEYRFNLRADLIQIIDTAIDNTSTATNRYFRTQVCPDPTKNYKLRFRCTNNKGLTIPTAEIISVQKTGSTTATITTNIPHGLTTTDYVVIYGIRNQTSFANLTTATAVASVPTPTTFTISFGASATATSFGGMVSRVQGGNIPTGYNVVAIQSAANDGTELTLVGNTNWSWIQGDYINVYGCRDDVTGESLGVDGAYKVAFVSTTTIRLLPIGNTTLPATFTTTNAGGTTIKRTDLRLSFVRLFDYKRERVEIQSQSNSGQAVPIVSTGGSVSVSGTVNPASNNNYALLSSTNLAANTTFTGSSTRPTASSTSSITYPVAIGISVQHTAGLTPGTLIYEVGTETSSTAPTTWYPQYTFPIPSNSSITTFVVPLTTRYYRIRFVNGSTAQTNFRLSTMEYYNGPLSNRLTFPDKLYIPLSTTNLSADAFFLGPTLDFGEVNHTYKELQATVITDEPSSSGQSVGGYGLRIEVSRNASTWITASEVDVDANDITTISADLVYRYARVVYTNGPVGTGSISIDAAAII